MSNTKSIPRTDICEDCDREIVGQFEGAKGKDELIQLARESEEGFMTVTAGSATISYACSCSYVEVEYGPGSVSAWDIPDGWLWEDDDDGE